MELLILRISDAHGNGVRYAAINQYESLVDAFARLGVGDGDRIGLIRPLSWEHDVRKDGTPAAAQRPDAPAPADDLSATDQKPPF